MKSFSKLNAALAANSFVAKLQLEVDSSSNQYDLLLDLVEEPNSKKRVQVVFRNISGLKCDFGLGGWDQILMLGIREELTGHERPLVVKEIEDERLRFMCASAELVDE